MTIPALADASIGALSKPKDDPQDVAMTRPDAMFVLNNMGIGGSERKIVRLANRLKDEGVNVTLACLNGPYTIAQVLRRDVPCTRLERKGKFSFATLWRMRQLLVRERPATVLAVNLYASLYVALATLLHAAAAAHRGAGEHLDLLWPPPVEAHLPGGAGAFRSHRARLGRAAAFLDQGQQRRRGRNPPSSTTASIPSTSRSRVRSRPASGCVPRWE